MKGGDLTVRRRRGGALAAVLSVLLGACAALTVNQDNVDWPEYLGDAGRSHYSPLTQINRENVSRLRQAWVYDSGDKRDTGTMYTSPLVVDGVLYGLSPKLSVFAVDAATGIERWRTDLGFDYAAQRGLMWWQKGNDRRVLFAARDVLVAVNADDGKPVAGFGKDGRVELRPADVPRRWSFSLTAPGVIFEDLVIVGFSTNENKESAPGSIRAFSVIDGSLVWQFDTIPAPGSPGSETWAEGAQARSGGANAWTAMALDADRGMLFAPTGSATPDFYGAGRLGDNLYANCLLAIDARTGKLRWHYQVVRHDLWDRDNPSPPTLVRMRRDGRSIDAVTITTKSGHLYAFDRDTGQSLYPLIDVPTLPSTMPGEVPAPVQRVSSVTISRQQFEITNRTPEARAFVENQIRDYDQRPWAPPKLGTVLFYPWYDGGGEWGGSAFDPAEDRLIVNSQDAAGVLTLTEIPAGSSNFGAYAKHCGSCHGLDLQGTDVAPSLLGVRERLGVEKMLAVVKEGSGRMPPFGGTEAERRGVFGYILSPDRVRDPPSAEADYVLSSGYVYLKDHEGLPGNSPPWGTLNSIDLATGKVIWKVPFGNFPSHPDLGYGSINYGGPVVTASGLVFIAATPDRKFRAFDSRDGKVLWETELNAAGFSTPVVYSVNGKQFVVIAAGGGRVGPPSGNEYVAFSLP